MNICFHGSAVMIATAAVLVVAPAAHAQQAPAAQPKTAQSAKPQPAKPQAAKPRAAKPQAAKPQTAKPAAPAIGGVQPVLLGQFGDWGAYTASPGGRKVCFALAKPKTSQTNPPNRPRDPIYMFISSRPAEKVKDEVSVVIGYGFKPNTDASLEIGGAQYAMYTQADGAWIKNAAEEPRLVETMRKSNDLTVKGTSARGTGTIDVFSLKGLDQALNRVGQECK
ncbi:invasion associated locus B family protein [Astrobacterium formosum]|uniref:invasion associated locus B family protein n=1 Tax=Astrobacterium formosum TaxID=3069710 RepID=UPI003F4F8AF8